MLGAGGTGDKGRQQRPWTAQRTQRESCAAATLSCDTLPRPIAPPSRKDVMFLAWTWKDPLHLPIARIWSREKQKRTTQPFESGNEHVVGFRMRHPDG